MLDGDHILYIIYSLGTLMRLFSSSETLIFGSLIVKAKVVFNSEVWCSEARQLRCVKLTDKKVLFIILEWSSFPVVLKLCIYCIQFSECLGGIS